jgi:hypothetical protein
MLSAGIDGEDTRTDLVLSRAYTRHGLQRLDCLAGVARLNKRLATFHARLELKEAVAKTI